MTRIHEQNESRNTVSADEKGRLKYCKFVFCRCNMHYCDAYGSKIQFNLSSTYYSMRNRIVLNSQIVSEIRLYSDWNESCK